MEPDNKSICSDEFPERRMVDAIVMGASAGGLSAIRTILSCLTEDACAPVMIVQHISPDSENFLPEHCDPVCRIRVKEAEDKEFLSPGTAYFAPPDYHLMVEPDHSLTLSMESRVNYSRPSIDVLFETAAEVFQGRLVGVILTGANADGAQGLAAIKRMGGLTLVQDPLTADVDVMPLAAIRRASPDRVVRLNELGPLLNCLSMKRLK